MANQVSLIQNISLVKGIYVVTFSVNNNQITPYFSQLIQEFSEPTISIGGTYTPSGPTPPFTLPVSVYRLISDLPIVYNFDPSANYLSSTYIQQQTTYFATQFAITFDAAVDALLASSDTISGDTILNFPM